MNISNTALGINHGPDEINYQSAAYKAVKLWEKLTGSNVISSIHRMTLDGMDLSRLGYYLRQSLEMDETGTLTLALIEAYRWTFLEQTNVPLSNIVLNSASLKETLSYVREIDALLTESGF